MSEVKKFKKGNSNQSELSREEFLEKMYKNESNENENYCDNEEAFVEVYQRLAYSLTENIDSTIIISKFKMICLEYSEEERKKKEERDLEWSLLTPHEKNRRLEERRYHTCFECHGSGHC